MPRDRRLVSPDSLYFGPPDRRKPWEIQVETPVGERCDHCGELIGAGDVGTIDIYSDVYHLECNLRTIIGSVAHVERRCSCYGGPDSDVDPPLLTRREAALASVAAWKRLREGS